MIRRRLGELPIPVAALILGTALLASVALLVALLLGWQDEEERDRTRRTAQNVRLRITMHLRSDAEFLAIAPASLEGPSGGDDVRRILGTFMARQPQISGIALVEGGRLPLTVPDDGSGPSEATFLKLYQDARLLGRPGTTYFSEPFACGAVNCFALVQPAAGDGRGQRAIVAVYSLQSWLGHLGPRIGEDARVRVIAADGSVLAEIPGTAGGDPSLREAVSSGGVMGQGTTIEIAQPPARARANVIGLGVLAGLITAALVASIGGLVWQERERRRISVEAATRDTELRGVFASLVEGVLVIAPDGRIRTSNESARRILGMSQDELAARPLGDPRWRFVSTTGEPIWSGGALLDVMRGRLGAVLGLQLDDGSIRWLSLHTQPLPDDSGSALSGSVVSFSDVTESRRVDELLRQAVRVSQIGIYDHDQVNDVVYWSPEQRAMVGWDADKPYGLQDHLALIHPEDRDAMVAAVQRAHDPNGDGTFAVEHRLVRQDGVRWVSVRGQTFFAGEGAARRAVRSLGAALDVTERRLAEEALGRALESALSTQRELRLHEGAIQAAANAIVVTERDGRIVWVNRAFCELTGYSAEEAVGQSPRVLRSGAHPAAFYAELWTTVLAGRVWRGDIVNRRKDGTLYTEEMTITPLLDEAGEVSHFVAVKQDVGWRREAEARLRAAAEEWRATFDALDTAVVLLDASHRVVRLNRPAAELLDCDWKTCLGLVPWEHAPRQPWTAGRELILSRAPETRQVGDEHGRVFELSARTVPAQGPDEPQVVLALRDVTRIAELQESVRRAETFAAMGRLVGGVAHEVRNPLFAMSVNIDALAAVLAEDAEVSDMLAALRQERDRISRLMEDLLHYGRPARVTMQVRPLDPVIAAAVRAVEAVAASRQVRLRRAGRAGSAVLMNAGRLEEVFSNLLENACQHSPAGSEVVIEVDRLETRRGAQISIEVKDAGPGFAADVLPRVFEPFFTRRKGGTGLGLAIVERFVAEHGGRVHASNRQPGGGVVTVELPAVDSIRS